MARSAWALLALLLCVPAWAGDVRVISGDTIEIDGSLIQLWGVSAPDHFMVCKDAFLAGEEARDTLAGIIGNRAIDCVAMTIIDPSPIRAAPPMPSQCFVDGVDVGAEMIGSGLALNERGPDFPRYAEREDAAREAGLGLWGHDCLPEWVVDIREHWAEQAGR